MILQKIKISLNATTLLLLALACCALIYSFGLNGPFIFDDIINIPQAQITDLSWQQLINAAFQDASGYLGRPLTMMSFAITNYLFNVNPFYFKLINLILHLITTIALFFLSKSLLTHINNDNKTTTAIATMVATLWCLHPMQVSTVLYAVQQMAILSALFCTLGCYCYVRWRYLLNQPQYFTKILYSAGFIISLMLATLSKENGLLLPVYVLVIEYFIFQFKVNNPSVKKQLLLFHLPLTILPILLGAIFLIANFSDFLGHYNYREFSLYERLLTEIKALAYYLRLLIVPDLSEYSLYHDDFAIAKLTQPLTIICIIIISGLITASIVFRKRAAIFCFGIAWFFSAHLMESTFFPLELVFEHRNYLASFGIMLIIGYYTYNYLSTFKLARNTLMMAIIVVLSTVTVIRVESWSDTLKLYHANIINHPLSPRANIDWSNLLIASDNWPEALQYLDKVVALRPKNPGPLVHKMQYYCLYNEPLPPELLEQAQDLLLTTRSIYYVANTLVILSEAITTNQCEEGSLKPKDLIYLLQTALNNPAFISHKVVTQQLYHVLAKLYLYNGRYNAAMQSLDAAFQANPRSLKPLLQKAIQQISGGQLQDASFTLKHLKAANANTIVDHSGIIDELESQLKKQELISQARIKNISIDAWEINNGTEEN